MAELIWSRPVHKSLVGHQVLLSRHLGCLQYPSGESHQQAGVKMSVKNVTYLDPYRLL